MNGNAARLVRIGSGLLGLVVVGWVLTGQAGPVRRGISLPTDWSHHHLIFTRPGTAEKAARVSSNPRFWQQMYRQQQRLVLPVARAEVRGDFRGEFGTDIRDRINFGDRDKLHRDWSQGLGANGLNLAGNYPAKFSFDINTASCSTDYVVYSNGLPGFAGTQADIIAFNNLYSGCTSGTVPSVYWAYNTMGAVYTSPVVSLDGSQIAFVQTDGSNRSYLALLRWAASTTDTVTSPTTLSSVGAGAYFGCSAPCVALLPLQTTGGTATEDIASSPFYDYANDIMWVGDNTGLLHKFTGVFKGTPTEATAPWPFQVSTSAKPALTAAIFDQESGDVFVEDADGYLYSVTTTGTITATASARLDVGTGFVEGPVVDSSNGLIYAFSSSDGSGACAGGSNCTAVFQFPVGFASGSSGSKVVVGNSTTGETPAPLYIGAFDSTYLNSDNGTGNLYVCGNTSNNPAIYQVPIAAGVAPASGTVMDVMASATTGPITSCSPVTDFANPNGTNGPAERVFVSVQDNGISTNCAGGGCVLDYLDTPWKATTGYAVGEQILDRNLHVETAFVGGTSGATTPTWPDNATDYTFDGTVAWVDQGYITASLLSWASGTTYVVHDRVIDSNGNVEIAETPSGTSGATAPHWSTTIGTGTTLDGSVLWLNAGPVATFALSSAGGTGGIVVDNAVNPTVMGGASQVYFFTLGSQACASGPAPGECAVQASQSALE
jgi:hypothetical protein